MNNINWEDYRKDFQNYSEKGLTYSEILVDLKDNYGISVSDTTVMTVMKNFGFIYRYSKNHKTWLDSEINELREYLNKKFSFEELEEKFKGRHTLLSIKGIIKERGKKLDLVYQGSKRIKFTESFMENIKDELKNNKIATIGLLSKKYGINSSRLRKAFIRVFGEEEYERYKNREKSFKISKKELEYNVNVLGLTVKEIAKKYNTTKDIIGYRKQSYGIKTIKTKPEKEKINLKEKYGNKYEIVKRFLGKEPTENFLKKSYENIFTRDYILSFLEKLDFSSKKVSEELGISYSLVDKLRRHFNIKSPKKISKKDFSKEFYYKCFVEDNMSYDDIGEITGLNPETIRKYIHSLFKKDELVTKRTSGERIVLRALKSFGNLIEFSPQSYHTDIATEYRQRVLIDFEVIYNNKTYWIEYNGEQHYNYKFYKSLGKNKLGMDKFISLLNRDRCVRNYAKENNIILIEIPYSIKTTNRVIKILTDIIINGKNPEEIINLDKVYDKIRSYGIDPI